MKTARRVFGGGSPFLGASGQQLLLHGRPYRFVGFNMWRAAVNSANVPPNTGYLVNSGTILDTSLKDLLAGGAKINAFRTFFLQQFALHNGAGTGVYDWSAFDKVLSVADANGFKVIACLADQWSFETDSTTAGPGALTTPFYGSWNGSVFTPGTYSTGPWTTFEFYSYRQFVTDVVTRYKSDPRILFWELGNELSVENPIGTLDVNGEPILAGFVADMGALIKSIDPNHLLSLGCGGNGNGGTSSGDYQTIHASPYLDLCSYHDYQPWASQGALTADQRWIQSFDTNNGLNVRVTQAAALNKPVYVGEAGLHANAAPCSGNLTTTSPGRGFYLNSKMGYAFNTYTGIVGYLPWQYDDRGLGSDDYNYGPTDPSLGVISTYGL